MVCISIPLPFGETVRARVNMGKNICVLIIGAMLFVLCVSAEAQQPKKIHRMGYLSSLSPSSESNRSEAIRIALRELGYVEGQNIAIEYRYGDGKPDRAPEIAADLVRLKVDIILVTGGSPWIRTAKNATKTIPVVMSNSVVGPVEAGLIESLARPGVNVTGLTLLSRELGGKRLELLKEAIPKVARVALLYELGNPFVVPDVKEVEVAARALGLTLKSWEVRDANDFERVFATLRS